MTQVVEHLPNKYKALGIFGQYVCICVVWGRGGFGFGFAILGLNSGPCVLPLESYLQSLCF
jgi:hypothetical protein